MRKLNVMNISRLKFQENISTPQTIEEKYVVKKEPYFTVQYLSCSIKSFLFIHVNVLVIKVLILNNKYLNVNKYLTNIVRKKSDYKIRTWECVSIQTKFISLILSLKLNQQN